MKTQSTKQQLNLVKNNIIELNNTSLNNIRGGWTTSLLSNVSTITNFSKDTLCTSDNQQE
ncbi:hypothetical protein [Lacinutrix sp. Hel_I_90]|uniref:hypothetical protein n=1 Tax=Lacinutrix sp. Hel_I_90 TaxID=1249999 RepID=UPI0005CACE1B|nr:hypothetical protein [Lacinutrix sp. Hel_I_90]